MKGHQRIRQAAITIDGCLAVIEELASTGDKQPSVKLALWAAILSSQTKLAPNGRQTRVLAEFVHANLPTDETALRCFVGQGTGAGVTTIKARGLLEVERMERAGTLPECPQDDWSLAQWEDWAERVGAIYGLGLKTARFAGLLLAPRTCPLVPVDMWVMIRLGYDRDHPKNQAEYMDVVQQVMHERDRNGYSYLPLGAWHWFKWSEIRQECGAEPLSERPESHANLSPRWY